jgi:hypothetical protein
VSTVYRVEFVCTNLRSGQEQLTTAHVQTDVPIAGSEPDADEVLGIVADHFSTTGHDMVNFRSGMYSSARLDRIRVREEVDPATPGAFGAVAEETINLAGTQVASGDQTPDGLCVWIAFRTAAAIRSGRGGTHLPGPYEADRLDSNGLWDSGTAFWTAVQAVAAKFADDMEDTFQTTGDVNWVVYSRTRRARAQSPYVFGVTSVAVQQRPRWLRRRMV